MYQMLKVMLMSNIVCQLFGYLYWFILIIWLDLLQTRISVNKFICPLTKRGCFSLPKYNLLRDNYLDENDLTNHKSQLSLSASNFDFSVSKNDVITYRDQFWLTRQHTLAKLDNQKFTKKNTIQYISIYIYIYLKFLNQAFIIFFNVFFMARNNITILWRMIAHII